MDEQVGLVRGLTTTRGRRGVAGQHDLAARSSRAEHRVGGDHPAVASVIGSPPWSNPTLPAGRDAERVRGVDVEAAGPLVLDERVADRGDAVIDGERLDAVLAALERLPRLELDELERVREPPEERPQLREQVLQPLRPVHRERRLVPAAQRKRLQHPRQAEEVVGVEVRQEDVLEVGQADDGALQLPLRPLGAVEEQLLAAAPHQERRRRALCGRHRAPTCRERGGRGPRRAILGVSTSLARGFRRSMADPTVLEVYRREITPELYAEIRELYKTHSIAEDARDLPGLISTLTPDCVYELVQTGHRWEGHEGAARFYTQLLTAFPDIRFDLTDIVIGPQGVCEEADVTATHQAPWLGVEPTGERLEWKVVIWFPWDQERRLFRGEKVYVSGIELPHLLGHEDLLPGRSVAERGGCAAGASRRPRACRRRRSQRRSTRGCRGLHDVGPLGPGAARAERPSRRLAPEDEHDDELGEHVFVTVGEQMFVSSEPCLTGVRAETARWLLHRVRRSPRRGS